MFEALARVRVETAEKCATNTPTDAVGEAGFLVASREGHAPIVRLCVGPFSPKCGSTPCTKFPTDVRRLGPTLTILCRLVHQILWRFLYDVSYTKVRKLATFIPIKEYGIFSSESACLNSKESLWRPCSSIGRRAPYPPIRGYKAILPFYVN